MQSVAGRTGAVTLALADISGLGGAAALSVGTAAGTVAAGDDSRLVANGAVVSTNGTGIRWQMITTAGQILTRFRDSVAAAASGVAGAWAGLEVAVGIKAPVVNATQSVTVNAEAVTGGSDGKSAVIWADGAGRIIARLLLTGVLDVPALLVRGAATFASTAGITVAKLITGSEAVQSTTRSTSLMTVEDGNGRVVARVRNTGVVEVPALKASGYIVAPAVYPRDPVTVTQVGVSNAAVTALNANLPTMPTGLPPSPTFSKSVATYGLATRHASESMGIAVTGRRVWCAFYGQNSVTGSGPGTTTAETDGAYVVLAYCDNYPTGTWTECLYILPTAYTGSGGAGVGRCIDPVLYTAPDGRLLVMWKSTGISNVTDTTITNTAVMAFLIQNPQAAAGVFVVGRMQYLGVGRPEAPGVLGSDVYMLNDQASGTITWGKLTTSGADSLTYTVLNTLPAFSSPASIGLECSWAPLSSGEVIALFRTSNGLYTVTSTAGVSGWGSPVQWTAYANPTNGTPNGARAVITRSPYSGRLMIVFNNHATQRYNMSATFSSDDAATWPTIMLIDPRNSAYPAVAFDATGRPMIATDHNRGALTQEMDVWRIDEDAIFAGSPLIEKSIAALGVV